MKCFICGYSTEHNELLLKHISSNHKLEKYDYVSYIKSNRICEVCNDGRGILQWNTIFACSACFDKTAERAERRVAQEIDGL